MISGEFGDIGQLFFEIELIAASGKIFPIEVMLDTGFTTGWLAINSQDIEILEWPVVERQRSMQTARGEEFFEIYAGKVLFDSEEFDIPVIAGSELPESLIGLEWLKTRKLVVDFPAGLLTLG
ncbi:MAG: aspartyl protease [Oscillatoriaceae cyanobacterium Prado104]|jgi:predicted aspartyl protease|nr:aspartyl protease [Oscillatoriaceae cyanobacterium Prado104]